MKWLLKGLAGHPLHPPLTDATIGFGLLTLGGWLGGAIVFVHGMRVLSLVSEPAERAVAPVPHAEKEQAEGG